MKWKLPNEATIEHINGRLWALTKDNDTCLVIQNAIGEPQPIDYKRLDAEELVIVAKFARKHKKPL